MALHLQGEKDLARPLEEVWAKLSDARFLVQCIPGVESVASAEADQAVCVLRPGFSFVRGTLEVTLRVVERVPGQSVRAQAHSKGIGSTSDVETRVTFTPRDGGAHLDWTVEIQDLGGLLKAVPQGLVKASAQKVVADLWASLEARLAS